MELSTGLAVINVLIYCLYLLQLPVRSTFGQILLWHTSLTSSVSKSWS